MTHFLDSEIPDCAKKVINVYLSDALGKFFVYVIVLLPFLGAILIGYKVSDTIWKDIVDLRVYNSTGDEKLVMRGEIAALLSAAIWLMIATFMKIPVSGKLLPSVIMCEQYCILCSYPV